MFGTFSNPILEAMVDENRPKREANDSKQPSKASKTPKAAFSKKHLKNHEFFTIFENKGLSRMSLEAQDVHNESPTEIQTTKERNPKSKP